MNCETILSTCDAMLICAMCIWTANYRYTTARYTVIVPYVTVPYQYRSILFSGLRSRVRCLVGTSTYSEPGVPIPQRTVPYGKYKHDPLKIPRYRTVPYVRTPYGTGTMPVKGTVRVQVPTRYLRTSKYLSGANQIPTKYRTSSFPSISKHEYWTNK